MSRTVPVAAMQSPGNLIAAALWNAGVVALNAFLTGAPFAQLTQGTVQGLANNTLTAVAFDQTNADSDGGHSNVTNNSRYTCQVAGWYLVWGTVFFAPSNAGSRKVLIYKNGAVASGSANQGANAGSSDGVALAAFMPVKLAVGDYVETWVNQDSGGSLNTVAASPNQSAMSVLWVST